MSLFEIKCVVKPAKLADVLILLDGLTIEPPMVTPLNKLNGATKSMDTMTKSVTRNGAAVDLMTWLKSSKLKKVTGKQVRSALEPLGYRNYYYGIQCLLNDGVLKKTKEYSTYDVVTK